MGLKTHWFGPGDYGVGVEVGSTVDVVTVSGTRGMVDWSTPSQAANLTHTRTRPGGSCFFLPASTLATDFSRLAVLRENARVTPGPTARVPSAEPLASAEPSDPSHCPSGSPTERLASRAAFPARFASPRLAFSDA